MADRRWDGDEQGDGVADAERFVDGAAQLVAAMGRPNWVAEQPELHLLPHLERACESLPLEILDVHTTDDGVYDVRIRWTEDDFGAGAVRAAIFSLVGAIAEPASYVRQRRVGEQLTFEVVTGIVDDAPFKPHGHTLRLTVTTVSDTSGV